VTARDYSRPAPDTLAHDLAVLRALIQRQGLHFAQRWADVFAEAPVGQRVAPAGDPSDLLNDMIVLRDMAARRGGPWLQRWVRLLACSPNTPTAAPSPEYRDLSPLDPRD
jgi:hypothetical protein